MRVHFAFCSSNLSLTDEVIFDIELDFFGIPAVPAVALSCILLLGFRHTQLQHDDLVCCSVTGQEWGNREEMMRRQSHE